MNGVPRIMHAATAVTTYDAARRYVALDMSIIPCIGKKCALSHWMEHQTRRANDNDLLRWFKAGLLKNVGIVCGEISANLVVIDLDGQAACEAFASHFPDLLGTYTVASGSGAGQHLYLYADILPPTTRVVAAKYGNIELRAHGCYVIAPPSVHPNGKPYRVERAADILHVHQLNDVVQWIKSLIAEKHAGTMPPPANEPRPVVQTSAWARRALEREADAVRFSLPGGRNNRLNLAAFKLGQLVKLGRLSRDEVERELTDAAQALAQSDGAISVARTIRSGLEAGMNKPIFRREA